MPEQQHNSNLPAAIPESPQSDSLSDAWREVGAQFQQLGNRLATALKQSWASSGNEDAPTETMRRLRDDLREAANRVDHVMHEVNDETREERLATLRATRRASEQSLEEARVLTAATLRKLNRQLDHLARRMDNGHE